MIEKYCGSSLEEEEEEEVVETEVQLFRYYSNNNLPTILFITHDFPLTCLFKAARTLFYFGFF